MRITRQEVLRVGLEQIGKVSSASMIVTSYGCVSGKSAKGLLRAMLVGLKLARHSHAERRSIKSILSTTFFTSAISRSLGGVFCPITNTCTLYPNSFIARSRAQMSARAPLFGGQGKCVITCKTFIGVSGPFDLWDPNNYVRGVAIAYCLYAPRVTTGAAARRGCSAREVAIITKT